MDDTPQLQRQHKETYQKATPSQDEARNFQDHKATTPAKSKNRNQSI